jgi:sugar lactone lactonase YvrE
MPVSRLSIPRAGLAAATLALAVLPYASAQQSHIDSRPSITLANAKPTEASSILGPDFAALAENYREFAAARVGEAAAPETFTLRFHQTTTLTGIAATGDFHVSWASCAEGDTYSEGDECTVEMIFTPQGPGHRTGRLTVTHSASEQPMIVPAGGLGMGPAVSFIPSTIATVYGTGNDLVGVTGFAPEALALDGGDNLYIADTYNNVVRFRDSSGNITKLAGGGANSSPTYKGPATGVQLASPEGIAVDRLGDAWISDTGNNVVRMVGPFELGSIATAIGGGARTACNQVIPCSAANISITHPSSIAFDPTGAVFVNVNSGTGDTVVQQQDPFDLGILDTFYLDTMFDRTTGSFPITVDAADNLYTEYGCSILAQNQAASYGNLPSEQFWTVAGSGVCNFNGDGGQAAGAEISSSVGGFAWDAAGNFYFTDSGNNRVRRIDGSTGIIRTVAGNGAAGDAGDGGASTNANVWGPSGIAVASNGGVYVTSQQSEVCHSGILLCGFYDAVRTFGATGQMVFGAQVTGTSSAAQTILLSNVGNAALDFTHEAFTSGNTGDFAIDPNTTGCNFAVPLPSGQNCLIGVIFTPGAVGNRSAVLTLLDNTVSGSNTIVLTGAGAPPALPKVTLASKANPALEGKSIDLTARVAGAGSPEPTGKVELREGDSVLATSTLSGGAVSFKLTSLSAGAHELTAYYLGDKLHKAAESTPIRQVVSLGGSELGN